MNSSSDSQCGGSSKFSVIEFAMRTNLDAPWIPLQLNNYGITNNTSSSSATVRGYNVPIHLSDDKIVTESVHICGNLLHDVQEVQFRWMATSTYAVDNETVRSEMWALANVTANLVIESETIQIFQDTFGSDTLK